MDATASVASVTDKPVSGHPPWDLAGFPEHPVPEPVPQAGVADAVTAPQHAVPPQAAARPAAAQPAAVPPRAGAPAARVSRGAWWTALPYLAVLAGAGTGLWWTWQSAQRVRGGTVAIAGALFVAALARLVLPEKWAGMLATRKRFTDVVTLVALASGLLAAGLLLPASP